MKVLRRLKKLAQYGLVAILSIGVVLTIGIFTPSQWFYTPTEACTIEIAVVSNGFHTNLTVPIQTPLFDWRQQFSAAEIGTELAADYPYLQIGWGERLLYMQTPTWQDFKLSNALKAIFYPYNASVLQLQGRTEMSTSRPGFAVKRLQVSDADYLKLMAFFQQSFQRDGQGRVQRIKDGYFPGSGFYEATGYYSLFRTCNSWTIEALRVAHINTPLWGALAPAVMLHLKSGCIPQA